MMPAQMLSIARNYSPYLARQLDNGLLDSERLSVWLERSLNYEDFVTFSDWSRWHQEQNETELAHQLRLLRRYVMAHIITRDLARVSHLAEVTTTITLLADFAIRTAEAFAHQYYADLYGQPCSYEDGAHQRLSVVAMGKMGGYELNVSSDIDLIFVFPQAGETDGKRPKSNQEFFTKVGQKIIALLNNITGDGQVFRVDMRLRPDGDAGPLVINEVALEQYLITQGREWERYAWIKARIVTAHANDIAALVRPFVFRKYLDFNAYAAMRRLHEQIQAEVSRKGMSDNIKLGAGGIREVEFVAQIFQLIRGGQLRSLQSQGTQDTLQELAKLNILPPTTVETLLAAYVFLRDTEHRLQYWEDQQTQTLPASESQQLLLAQSMGFKDYAAFLDQLNQHRQAVNQIFRDLVKHSTTPQPYNPDLLEICQSDDPLRQQALLQKYGFEVPYSLQRLNQLQQSSQYRQLSASARQHLDEMKPSLLEVAAKSTHPTQTLSRILDFLEAIGRRSAYLAFLHEHPEALEKLANLMSQSSWAATYLCHHPVLLDEILSNELLQMPQESASWSEQLTQALDECGDDVEAQMDALRRFQHAQIFRLTVQDLAGLWQVESLSDQLSALADVIIQAALTRAWAQLPHKHTEQPRFAVIGYGKLGGKELGYTSDLDLVYIFDDDHPDAADTYTRLARRLTSWLTVPTGAGLLYDVDLRLRPNGDAGFNAIHIQAFTRYQRQQAWTWEHQALTRARFIGGHAAVGQAFEQVRQEILCRPHAVLPLQQDIIAMREKMFPTHPPRPEDVKYMRGGVVDVEFIVQYLILAHAHQYPQLLQNYGNIALLNMAAALGLIDARLAEASRQAYRYYRQQQHNTRLHDAQKVQVNEILLAHCQAVCALWRQVFGQPPRQNLISDNNLE